MRPILAAALLAAAVPLFAASPAGIVTTIAGTPETAGLRDGNPSLALFNKPTWIDFDRHTNSIYVVDRLNSSVRRIAGDGVTTLKVQPSPYTQLGFTGEFGGPFGGGIAVELQGGCGGGPYGYGIFVSMTGAQQLAQITDNDFGPTLAARDDALPFVGQRGTAGARDGDQNLALFHDPTGVALSWGYTGGRFNNDRVYIADTGNHTIRYVHFRTSFEGCPQPFFVGTLAGRAGESGSTDGDATTARFNSPRGIASAPDGSVYVADAGDHTIRRVTPDGHVTTVAGVAGESGSNDGVATQAHLNTPSGIDVDVNGVVYIADTGNATIRRLTPDGMLTTIAGTPGVSGFADGDAHTALFNGPVGVKVHGQGLLIADTSNHVIREWVPVPSHRRIVH
jgi:hypothetical protein